jgi:hypothetical protein
LQELVGDGHVQVRQRLQLQPPMMAAAEHAGAREAVGPLRGCFLRMVSCSDDAEQHEAAQSFHTAIIFYDFDLFDFLLFVV